VFLSLAADTPVYFFEEKCSLQLKEFSKSTQDLYEELEEVLGLEEVE
jgi:hypothetical protein